MKRSPTVLLAGLLLVTDLLLPLAQAASQAWVILPGRAVGPVRLGMTPSDVLAAIGRPSSREADRVWMYEVPAKVRVEFQGAKVHTITTWDQRARTPEGLRVGSPQTSVVRALGESPVSSLVEGGVWLYGPALGLAVFVQKGVAGAFSVIPRLSGTAARTPPRGVTQSAAPQTQIMIENVSHKVDSAIMISGAVRNVGQLPKRYVDLVVSARTFRGEPLEEKRVELKDNYIT